MIIRSTSIHSAVFRVWVYHHDGGGGGGEAQSS
jgi:hypothetical protein